MTVRATPEPDGDRVADCCRRLNAEPSKRTIGRAEYQRAIMNAAIDPAVHTVAIMTGSQRQRSEAPDWLVYSYIADSVGSRVTNLS